MLVEAYRHPQVRVGVELAHFRRELGCELFDEGLGEGQTRQRTTREGKERRVKKDADSLNNTQRTPCPVPESASARRQNYLLLLLLLSYVLPASYHTRASPQHNLAHAQAPIRTTSA